MEKFRSGNIVRLDNEDKIEFKKPDYVISILISLLPK